MVIHGRSRMQNGMDCEEEEALSSSQDEKFFRVKKTATLMIAARFCCLEK